MSSPKGPFKQVILPANGALVAYKKHTSPLTLYQIRGREFFQAPSPDREGVISKTGAFE